MSTVKHFLQKHFSEVAAIHAKHKSLAEAAGDEHSASFHQDMHDCFKAAHEECGGAESNKTLDTDAGKVIAVENVSLVELRELRASLNKISSLLGDRIMPDQIRGTIPSNPLYQPSQAVTRPGQPELVNKRDVPIEFQDLLKVDA